MRSMIFAALLVGTMLAASACGEQKQNPAAPAQSTVRETVKETAKAIDKTADHATGKAQLEQKKKIETRLNKIQQNQQNQLNQALKD